jgi:hypothetical protein
MMARRLVALLALALAFTLAQAAPAHIEHEVPNARLAGSGTFTYFAMTIYAAQLWVGPQGYSPSAPFALDLRYARKLNGKKIAEASAEQMEKIGAGTAAARKAWLQTMTAIFPDVQEGSHITGVYLPNRGARFYLDGKPLAAVDDGDFALAFFAIWLDPHTSAPALRAALLNRAGSS